jgi:hypothetical protein
MPDLASTRGAALANPAALAVGIPATSHNAKLTHNTGVPAQEAGASGPRDWAWGTIVVVTGLAAIFAVFIFVVLDYKTAGEQS